MERDQELSSEYTEFEDPVGYLSGKTEQEVGYTTHLDLLEERSVLETKFRVYNWTTGTPGMNEINWEKEIKEEDDRAQQ